MGKKHTSKKHMSKKHMSKKHIRRNTYKRLNTYKRRNTYKRQHNIKKRSYKKRRSVLRLPRSKGLPLFVEPEKTYSQSILVNQHQSSGNMIPGLRNMS
jgi:hypothetical protein